MRRIICSVLLVVLLFSASDAVALRKKKSTNIPCPNYIGDMREGTYYHKSTNTDEFPFECYNRVRKVRDHGFRSIFDSMQDNYTGWWRAKISQTKDTCGNNLNPENVINIFVQVRDNDSGVFAATCPGSQRYTGMKQSSGFDVAAESRWVKGSKGIDCGGGEVLFSETIEFDKVTKEHGGEVTFKRVERCADTESLVPPCTTEWRGEVFRETHPIWPEPANHINAFNDGCTEGLKTCENCHESLKKFPPLDPQ